MKFTAKSEPTRQLIIESTSAIFNKKGYVGTALSDLTEATKLSKGSIYGNFENKEAVAVAAFDYNLSVVQGLIQSKVDCYSSYKDKLLAHAQVYHSFENTPFPDGGCPLMNTATEADDTSEVLREKALDGLLAWKNKLCTLIENGIEAMEFKIDTDVNKTSTAIIALIEGGMMMAKVSRDVSLLDQVVMVMKDMVEGISSSKSI